MFRQLNIQYFEMDVWPVWPCRSARELQQQICARVEKMQERRRNPRGTVSEQMAVAEKDVEEVRPILHYSHNSSIFEWLDIDLNVLCSSPLWMTDEEATGSASPEDQTWGNRSSETFDYCHWGQLAECYWQVTGIWIPVWVLWYYFYTQNVLWRLR